MSELNKPAPSQSDIDQHLDPDHMSGSQIKALKAIDEKNLDKDDLAELAKGMLDAYNTAKQSD